MKNTKRGLSILLSLALLITSVGVGLGTGSFKCEVPAAETVSETADSSPIHFYVPEAIYLKPDLTSATTFQYFVDSTNSTSPSLSTDKAKTTGNVYFHCANATAVSISYTGASLTMGTTTGTKTISTTITAGAVSPGLAQNATRVLTWTANYTVAGVAMSAKAYTVCYAPKVDPVAVAIRTYNNDGSEDQGDKADFQGFAYIAGIHSFGNGGNRNANTSGTYTMAPMLGTVTSTTGNVSCESWFASATNGNTYYTSHEFGDDRYTSIQNSPTGTLTVDTSRYSNINQIPNLTCGFAVTHTNEMDGGKYVMYGSNFSATNSGWHYENQTSTDNNFQNTVIRNTEYPVIFYGSTSDTNMTNGTQYSGNVWSQSLSSYNIVRMKAAGWGNNDGEYNAIAMLVNVDLNKVNKNTLRNNIRNYTNLGLQAADYSGDAVDFTAFQNELAAAAARLGNPTGTDTSDSLQAKFNALTKNTYTATINHKFNDGKTTIVETQTFDSGDTVNFAPNSYTGYTLTSADGHTTSTAAQTVYNRRAALTQNYNYNINTYTITWAPGTNGTGGGQNQCNHGATPTPMAVTPNPGYHFVAWTPSVVAATGNTTYTATWAINSYTITWAPGTNGTGGGSNSCNHGATPTPMPVTADTGYHFVAWTPTIAAATGDTTYTATWAIDSYTITWDAGGGTGGTTTSVNHGATPTPPTVSRTGYTFDGWSPAIVAATRATTYTAQWNINSYTITFDGNGGSTPSAITQNYGTTVTAPANPTRAGHTFTGWSPVCPTTMPAGNTTCVAQWTANQYTISFNSNGGSAVSSVTQDYGTQASAPTAPTKAGNTFAGWYTDAGLTNAVSWPHTITGDVNFYAKWTVNNYNITFNANGGTGGTGPTSMQYGAALSAPVVTQTGYTFAGWDTTVPGTVPAADTTYTAQWTLNYYTVSFNTDGGSAVTPITQNYGTSVTQPTAPTKTGNTFDGWYSDVALTTAVSWPYDLGAANVTFYAKWTMNQSAIDGITVALTENENDMTVTVENAVAGCKYQIWSYQSITSDLLLDAESSVQANQWILSKAYDTTGQAVGTLTYTIDKFTSPNNNYTIAVRIVDGSGAYVREIRDSYTKTEVGTAEIAKVFVDGEYVRGSSQEDIDKNIKSTVLKEITPSAAPVIKVIGNLSGMTYTATVLETSEVLTAVGNEFTWNISGYIPQRYTVRVTASYGTTTDTLDLRFMLYSSSTSVQYGNMNSLSLTNGSPPLEVPQMIGINTSFSNGNFHYVVREMGRTANFTSGIFTESGTIDHNITQYGIYHVYGYANRTTMNPSEGNYDDGIIKPITIKRSNSPSSMTVVATPSFANPIAKGTAITITANASIAGIGVTPVEYSFWRYDAKGYVLIKDWSLDNTLAWTPGRVGEYTIQVRAKGDDAGSYEVLKTVEVRITDPKEGIAQGVVIELNETELDNAQARTPITIKASATNANDDALLYRFFVYDDAMLTKQLQAYSPNQECIWTPRKAGTYKILVQVKNEVSFGKYDATKSFEVTVN